MKQDIPDLSGGEPTLRGRRTSVLDVYNVVTNLDDDKTRDVFDGWGLYWYEIKAAMEYAEENPQEIEELIKEKERAATQS